MRGGGLEFLGKVWLHCRVKKQHGFQWCPASVCWIRGLSQRNGTHPTISGSTWEMYHEEPWKWRYKWPDFTAKGNVNLSKILENYLHNLTERLRWLFPKANYIWDTTLLTSGKELFLVDTSTFTSLFHSWLVLMSYLFRQATLQWGWMVMFGTKWQVSPWSLGNVQHG